MISCDSCKGEETDNNNHTTLDDVLREFDKVEKMGAPPNGRGLLTSQFTIEEEDEEEMEAERERQEVRNNLTSSQYYERIYTERQKKLTTSSGQRSLKSTPSKLIIFGHK